VRALLVRVGADQSEAGGGWNAPIERRTGAFVYVPIPEPEPLHGAFATPLARWAPAVERLGGTLPARLHDRHAHADPDFGRLTYGDRRERGRQIREKLRAGDILVFYAGLRDTGDRRLVYALIGLLTVDEIVAARDVPAGRRRENAHTRRCVIGETDIVVRGRPGASGRFERGLEFAGFRDGAYRVFPELLERWGGLSVRRGYVQRSARLPELRRPERFRAWLDGRQVGLVARDN
jgi:Nucleotide modification associated domain 3